METVTENSKKTKRKHLSMVDLLVNKTSFSM